MKSGRSSRRSIRYAIFTGVLAGSVFSGSGAFAAFEILNQNDLEAIGIDGTTLAREYVLMTDINLNAPTSGTSTYVTGVFTGTLDGNGKILSGLTKPLFDVIGTDRDTAEVSDLTLATASGAGVQGRGVLANDVFNSTIFDVAATGTLTTNLSSDIGGLIGKSIEGNIDRSSADVNILSSGENVGGLVGRSENTQIQNSIASGDITGGSNIGGLVGKSLNGSVESSSSTGTVSSVEQVVSNNLGYLCESWSCTYVALPVFTTQQNVGGLIGESTNVTILDSSSEGTITGSKNVGGLIGNSTSDTLINSSSSGEVIGEVTRLRQIIVPGCYGACDFLMYEESQPLFIGGLVGNATDITVTGSTATGDTEGLHNVGGLIGISTSGSISNSSASGDVIGNSYIGGLIGNSDTNSVLNNSTASGAVTGVQRVGGLIGTSVNSTISNASSSGNVINSIGTSGDYFGGLIGMTNSDAISSSNSSGAVASNGSFVGGLVGELSSSSTISNSQATGNVSTPYEYVGGLVGKSSGGISDSHATGTVSGAGYVGGLVGHQAGDLVDTYSTGAINGGTYSGGLVGYLEGNINSSYSTSSINQLTAFGNRIGGLIGIIGSGSVSNCYATGGGRAINGYDYVGGLVGGSGGNISRCYTLLSGDVSGVGYVGGLVGDSNSLIDNSFTNITGNVSSSGGYVGGLVGSTTNEITNSFARVNGNVSGVNNYVGGLAGTTSSSVANSYADVSGNISGYDNVGGLAGYTGLSVTNSYAHVTGNTEGHWNIGGLVGEANDLVSSSFASISNNVMGAAIIGGLVGNSWSSVENSYSLVLNNVIGSGNTVGGLVGFIHRGISNSYASISNDVIGASYVGGLGGGIVESVTNSYSRVGGHVSGDSNVGRLAGFAYGSLTDSYALGEAMTAESLTPNLVSLGSPVLINSCGAQINEEGVFFCNDGNSVVTDFNFNNVGTSSTTGLTTAAGQLGSAFATDACLNGPNPYLVSLVNSYENSCSGGDPTPPPSSRPIRERVEREVREVAESRAPEKIEKVIGFKNEAPLPKNSLISFVEATEKIDIAKVKAVEIAPTANVKVSAKAGEALQITLKSGSKEPVELWVKSPDGSWLLAGVITFDKDGTAILPPLQFKNAGDYSLVLSKPTADSAKGGAPLNQTGSLLVAVS